MTPVWGSSVRNEVRKKFPWRIKERNETGTRRGETGDQRCTGNGFGGGRRDRGDGHNGATTEPALTSSIEVVPGEAVSLTVEFAGDQPLTSDQIDAAVAEVTSELVPAALACGENVSNVSDDGFTLTYYNCSSVSIRLKPDYFLVDGTCKVVSPYGTTSWDISVELINSYVGMVRC